jgi:hypothetical protein
MTRILALWAAAQQFTAVEHSAFIYMLKSFQNGKNSNEFKVIVVHRYLQGVLLSSS